MLEAAKLINPYAVAALVVLVPIFLALVRDMARLTALVDETAKTVNSLSKKVHDDHEPRIRSTEISTALTSQRVDTHPERKK